MHHHSRATQSPQDRADVCTRSQRITLGNLKSRAPQTRTGGLFCARAARTGRENRTLVCLRVRSGRHFVITTRALSATVACIPGLRPRTCTLSPTSGRPTPRQLTLPGRRTNFTPQDENRWASTTRRFVTRGRFTHDRSRLSEALRKVHSQLLRSSVNEVE
jgi:hypothetical protein